MSTKKSKGDEAKDADDKKWKDKEAWAKKSKAKKSDDDGEDMECSKSDDGDDEEDDDGEDLDKTKKSLSEADLKKSLRMLKGFVEANDPVDRKSALLHKAQEGSLNKSERQELFGLLEGNAPAREEAVQPLAKSFAENETIQKSLDVTDFLQELTGDLCKSHEALADRIEKSQHSQGEFNLALAKAVSHVGHVHLEAVSMIKSMAERIGVIEAQPARGPKSAGLNAPLEKSFAGQPRAGESGTLNKSQVLDTLTELNELSYSDGRDGMSKSGDDITKAVSKYEQTNFLSKSLEAEVISHIQQKRQSLAGQRAR